MSFLLVVVFAAQGALHFSYQHHSTLHGCLAQAEQITHEQQHLVVLDCVPASKAWGLEL